ncbi:hypothetical protein PAE9249_04499 [Paenibacillus sp. CECT 9249]|nr:hypothetical protein PAE9249_04499 [Paenibacillus sp. CECT 9249]
MHETIETKIASLAWERIHQTLDRQGFAKLPPLLDSGQCLHLIGLYEREELYRSKIEMSRYRFGEGEYKYFASPLPSLVQQLRASFYPELAQAANRWLARLGKEMRYPAALDEFLASCHIKGQLRPTPLILKYTEGKRGDYTTYGAPWRQ